MEVKFSPAWYHRWNRSGAGRLALSASAPGGPNRGITAKAVTDAINRIKLIIGREKRPYLVRDLIESFVRSSASPDEFSRLVDKLAELVGIMTEHRFHPQSLMESLPGASILAVDLLLEQAKAGINPTYTLRYGISAIDNAFSESADDYTWAIGQLKEFVTRLTADRIGQRELNHVLRFAFPTIASTFKDERDKFVLALSKLGQLAKEIDTHGIDMASSMQHGFRFINQLCDNNTDRFLKIMDLYIELAQKGTHPEIGARMVMGDSVREREPK